MPGSRHRPPDDQGDGHEPGDDHDGDDDRPPGHDDGPDADDEDGDGGSEDKEPAQPVSITERRRRRGRGPGGPDDGGSSRAARAGRRFGLGVLIVAIIAVILLFSVGIDLWTDALWFKSVGFDSVFWTRIGATVTLGVGAFLIAAIALLGNLWIAGRLAPPPGRGWERLPLIGRPAQRRRPGGRRATRRHALAVRPGPRQVGRPDHQRGHLRRRRHPRPDAARRLGPRRPGAPARAVHRRRGVGRLGDGPAVDPPRAVLGDVERHRPDLRQGHQLLPVRAPVPSADPGRVQRDRPARRSS